MDRFIVLVAGGQGTRMKASLPKQFLLMNDQPVILHTVKCFQNCNAELVVVLDKNYHSRWKNICREYNFTIPHLLVEGGNTRAESVLNGLKKIQTNSLVAVHDAVRPIVSSELIEKLFNDAAEFGNAVPVIDIKESMREMKGDKNVAVDRSKFRLVQTPQCFITGELLKAFSHPQWNSFTDEASLFEQNGNQIHLTEGEHSNIKITYPEDLVVALTLLSNKNK